MRRKIIQIDENKCNGCGLCIPNCAEGALTIINGKARLVSDKLCDGLGACLGHCPQDAVKIIEREADEFDEIAVNAINAEPPYNSCPGSQIRTEPTVNQSIKAESIPSQLIQWPIQLHLVPATAPFFNRADLLISASCVPFSYGDFHNVMLAGKTLIIACPKLDRTDPYLEKLTEVFRQNDIKSITIAIMEVPCCQGLLRLVQLALKASGKKMPITVETISIQGERL